MSEDLDYKILITIQEHEKSGAIAQINSSSIANRLGLSKHEINKYLRELELRGFIGIKESVENINVWLEPSGKNKISDGIGQSYNITNYNIGAIIQSLSGSNIQAVALSHNSDISQIVNDPEALRNEVESLTDQVVNAVRVELGSIDFQEYVRAIEDLRNQILSSNPNPSIIKRLLGTLSFFGDVEGSIALMGRVWPYISPLLLIAIQLLD